MRARKPGLPEHMEGGVRNPLGAMALYLGNTLYRIHGTNEVKSIGTAASSGCIRMTNGNVTHLAQPRGRRHDRLRAEAATGWHRRALPTPATKAER